MSEFVNDGRAGGVKSSLYHSFAVLAPRTGEAHVGPLRELSACFDVFDSSDLAAVDFSILFESVVQRAISGARLKVGSFSLASGATYEVDLEDRFAALLWGGRLTEAGDLNVFCRLARPGSFIVDVGANFGLYTIELARLAGGDATVVAFEPQPRQFALLEKNITRNGLARTVVAIQKAVSSTAGAAEFFVAQSNSFSGLRDTGRSARSETINVAVTSLDQEPAMSGRSVDLLKIDVEGAELDVLLGASGMIARSPNLVILFEATIKNQNVSDQREIIKWIDQRMAEGYALYCGFHGGDPGAAIEVVDDIGPHMTGNLFLVRKDSPSNKSLVEAIESEKKRIAERRTGEIGAMNAVRQIVRLLRTEINASELLRRQADELRRTVEMERHDHAKLSKMFDEENLRLAKEFARLAAALENGEPRLRELSNELAAKTAEARNLEGEVQRQEQLIADIQKEIYAQGVRERELRSALNEARLVNASTSERLKAIENSRWWRFGKRIIFPLAQVFRRRR